MTITQTDSRWTYQGDGSTKAFQFTNRIFSAGDLRVYLDGQVQSGGYSVTGVDAVEGGQVTFTVAPPPASRITIVRATPAKQLTAYPANDRFPATAHERALDKLTVLTQQAEHAIGRGVRLDDTDDDADLRLPVRSDRARRLFAFSAEGLPEATDATVEQIAGTGMAAWAQGKSIGDVPAYVGDGVTTRYPTGHKLLSKAGVHVEVGGVRQAPVAYALDDEDVVLVAPPPVGVPVHIRVLGVPVPVADASGSRVVAKGASSPRPLEDWLGDIANAKGQGAKGDGATTDTAALQRALDLGGDVYLPDGDYLVDGALVASVAGTRLYGPGRLVLASTFPDTTPALRVAAAGVTLQDFTIDGSAATAPAIWGIYADGVSYDVSGLRLRGVTAQHVTFDGIDINCSPGALRSDITIQDCRVIDAGWVGIQLTGVKNSQVKGNRIESTGYHGIVIWSGNHVTFAQNYVTKAVPPTHIYAGVGSYGGVEKGGLFAYAPDCSDLTVDNNDFVDNRNAGHDGIMAGEWATATEYRRINVTNNRVRLVNGFGIDVVGSGVVSGNTVAETAASGIAVMFDRGGTIRDLTLACNTIVNAGSHGIQIGGTIYAEYGNTLAIRDLTICGNTVSDNRPTKLCVNGITFPDHTTFENVLVASNNLVNVGVNSVANYSGTPLDGVRFIGNLRKDAEPLTVTADISSIVAHLRGRYDNIGTISFESNDGTTTLAQVQAWPGNQLRMYSGTTEMLRILSTGDILHKGVTQIINMNGLYVSATFTVDTLPSAAANPGCSAAVSNGTGGKPLVYSTGVNWLYADGTLCRLG